MIQFLSNYSIIVLKFVRSNSAVKFLFIAGYGPECMLVKQSRKSGVETLSNPFRKSDLATKVHDLLD